MEDFYTLGFEQESADGTILKIQEGAAPLRFIIGALIELQEDARAAEKIYDAPCKLYRLVEVGNVFPTDEEYANSEEHN